jgi:glycine C-acetyltransferase
VQPFLAHLTETLAGIEAEGLLKRERLIATPQSAHIRIRDARAQGGEREVINLCSNNYLGLADHPEVIAAAREALDAFGFGMASVRFICGAQTLHRALEERIAAGWARTIQSFSPPPSTPMAASSSRCSGRKTR